MDRQESGEGLRPPIVNTLPTDPFAREEMAEILAACDRLVTRGRYGSDANQTRVKAFVFATPASVFLTRLGSTPER